MRTPFANCTKFAESVDLTEGREAPYREIWAQAGSMSQGRFYEVQQTEVLSPPALGSQQPQCCWL